MSLEPRSRAIVGGTLIDGTGRPPVRDSVVIVKGTRIVAVGERGKVTIPDGVELIDVTGKTVLPGLIDAHTHFLSMGIEMIRTVDLGDTRSISEALSRVERKLNETKKGDWVLGVGWDDSKWVEKRYITKSDLDPLTRDSPIMLVRVCGHLITLNSKALSVASITRDTKNPPGGLVDKGPDGEPTGILRDARHLVERFEPPVTDGMAQRGLEKACELALSLGCTGVHEAGLDAFGMRAYLTALERGTLKVRAYLMWMAAINEAVAALGFHTGFGNEMVRLGSAKMLIDGSLGARTAALYEPYEDDRSTKGLLMMAPGDLAAKVRSVHIQGSQAAIHAIGDYGIELAINAVEEAIKGSPKKDHRHRIEHCEVLTTTQIERIKQLGIVPSMQPNFVGEWSGADGLYEARLGPKRLRKNNPYRLLIDEGIHLAFGSDCMPFNPMYGIWSAVNHPVKASRISLVEAVKGFTLDAAYASFEEGVKGSVEPGKLADITILDRDLTEIPSEGIKDVPIYMTLVGGEILYVKG